MKLSDEAKADAEALGAALVDAADRSYQLTRALLYGALRHLRQKRDAKRAPRDTHER